MALYNLTMALPPERLRYYVGRLNDGVHDSGAGSLTFQPHVALFANPLFVGFAPGMVEPDPNLLECYRRYIALYKRFMARAAELDLADSWCATLPPGLRRYIVLVWRQ